VSRAQITSAKRIVIKIGSSSLTGKAGSALDADAVNKLVDLVAACKDCNLHKGNRTPKEAKMDLKNKPKEPSYGFFFDHMLITFRKKKNA